MTIDQSIGLTDKQAAFCREYLRDFNATAAYKRAGYTASESAARVNASRLLSNANVQGYLAGLRATTTERAEITLERTLEEIAKVAFSNITQALSFNDSGISLEDSTALPESVTAAIESVTFTETVTELGGSTKKALKMHNKMAALGFLADYFGIRDDFNQARATLKRYGLALVEDVDSDMGWRLDRYAPNSDNP